MDLHTFARPPDEPTDDGRPIMNSPQRALARKRAMEETTLANDATKRDAARRETLKALEVKTVIREARTSAARAIEHRRATTKANGTRGSGGNLFATCGGNQVTVYDGEHFGDHVAVVAQYAHETTEHQRGGEVTCVCWVRSDEDEGEDGEKENVDAGAGATKKKMKTKKATTTTGANKKAKKTTTSDSSLAGGHEFGDAILTVGDEHGFLSVISVAENRVRSRIEAHAGAQILDLASADKTVGCVVSLGADGALKRWNVFGGADDEGECVKEISVGDDATCVSCDETGSFAITGHRDGSVKRWSLGNAGATKKLGFTSFPPTHGVECVKIVGDVAFAKTTDARVETFDLKKDASVKSWQLPFSSYRAKAKANALPCRFGVTSDGKFFACGDNLDTGIVYVYDAASAELISQLKPLRVTGVVSAVAIADHCRHVFSSYGPGVVWRYEIIPRIVDDGADRQGFEAVVKPR